MKPHRFSNFFCAEIKAQASSKGICIDAQVAIPLSSADEVYIRAVEKLSEQPFARGR